MVFIKINFKKGKFSALLFFLVIIVLIVCYINNSRKTTIENLLQTERDYKLMQEYSIKLLELFKPGEFDSIECAKVTLELKDLLEITREKEQFTSSEKILLDKMAIELDNFEKYISDHNYDYAVVYMSRFCDYLTEVRIEFQKSGQKYIDKTFLLY